MTRSIVLAAGGPDHARTQLVQRTLDLTWHDLRDDSEPSSVLCPSPQVRTLRLLDLTHWNDAPAAPGPRSSSCSGRHTTNRRRRRQGACAGELNPRQEAT